MYRFHDYVSPLGLIKRVNSSLYAWDQSSSWFPNKVDLYVCVQNCCTNLHRYAQNMVQYKRKYRKCVCVCLRVCGVHIPYGYNNTIQYISTFVFHTQVQYCQIGYVCERWEDGQLWGMRGVRNQSSCAEDIENRSVCLCVWERERVCVCVCGCVCVYKI